MIAFSPLGLALALAVLLPTFLLVTFPARTPIPSAVVPRGLRLVESTGQALCVAVPVLTAPGALVWGWCVPAGLALAAYYVLWVRYLVRDRDTWSLYRPLGPLPVPMAVFPVLAFLGGAAWLSNPWIALAAVVLAAGHIPAALTIARALQLPRNRTSSTIRGRKR